MPFCTASEAVHLPAQPDNMGGSASGCRCVSTAIGEDARAANISERDGDGKVPQARERRAATG